MYRRTSLFSAVTLCEHTLVDISVQFAQLMLLIQPSFVGGCGRFFEGTAEEMDTALNQVLGSLPADTKVYDGHNYSQGNVKFAMHVGQSDCALLRCHARSNGCCLDTDPENAAIKALKADIDSTGETTGKYTIADEREHNVFMRLTSEAVVSKTDAKNPVEAMEKLREMKNNFRG